MSVEDEGSANRLGVGTRVVVEAGGVQQVRWLTAGGTGLAGGGSPEAHFGLGDAGQVDRLQITWPDGEVSVFTDVAARQHAIVRR